MNANKTNKEFQVALNIFDVATSDITSTWKTSIESLLGFDIPAHIVDSLILESIYVGIALTIIKHKSSDDAEIKGVNIDKLHEQMIMLLAEKYFDSEDKIDNVDAHYEGVEEIYNEFCGSRISEYTKNSQEIISTIFSNHISDNFASENIELNQQLIDGYVQGIMKNMKSNNMIK